MSNQTAITLADKTTVRTLLKREDVIEQFTNILGPDAPRYMASVYLAVANSPELQECSAESVLRVAMRCAAKKLSCDPNAKEGQLVPRWNSKAGCKEATLIEHYKAQYIQAMRTGLYRVINVSEIYAGYIVEKDMLTGLHKVTLDRENLNVNKVTGYLGYYKTKDGIERTFWWPIEEINAHVQKYAPKNPLYNDAKIGRTMREKIVWRDMLSWMDKSEPAALTLDAAEREEEFFDGLTITQPETEQPAEEVKSEEQIIAELYGDLD